MWGARNVCHTARSVERSNKHNHQAHSSDLICHAHAPATSNGSGVKVNSACLPCILRCGAATGRGDTARAYPKAGQRRLLSHSCFTSVHSPTARSSLSFTSHSHPDTPISLASVSLLLIQHDITFSSTTDTTRTVSNTISGIFKVVKMTSRF